MDVDVNYETLWKIQSTIQAQQRIPDRERALSNDAVSAYHAAQWVLPRRM